MAPHPKPDKQIWQRIKFLIDKYEDGNVAATAKKLRACSQRGLAKIYNGETTNPHASVILAMARLYCNPPYNVDLHWLVTGRPSPAVEAAAQSMAKDLLADMLKSIGTGTGTGTPPKGSTSLAGARG